MSEVDLSTMSKSELKKLLRSTQRRLSRVKQSAEKPELKSSDERVVAVADRVRELSQELGLKRRDVLAAVAGNMRVSLETPRKAGKDGAPAASAGESAAPAPVPKAPSKPAKAAKAGKGKAPASARAAKKTTAGKRGAPKRAGRKTTSKTG